jgi:hypothetical protein
MELIHTMPLWINENGYDTDFQMLERCFKSLGCSKHDTIVIYNQGCINNDKLLHLISSYITKAIIIGEGTNIGIARARQCCFEYIWKHYPETRYISELHLDMIFPVNWYAPIIAYLERTDEPMLSPGIMTAYGELQPLNTYEIPPQETTDLIQRLEQFATEQIIEHFVHPVIHKSEVLKEIGGYDIDFLPGKQGYEDDSLLLGYLYYMGIRTRWKPKCYLKSWVYHATMAQRISLSNRHLDFELNERGLFNQYGVYGFKHLTHIYPKSPVFPQLMNKYKKPIN